MEEAGSRARWINNLVDSKSKQKLTSSARGRLIDEVVVTALGVGVKATRAGFVGGGTTTAAARHGESNCHAGED